MLNTRPQDGDTNWGQVLNNHLAQTLGVTGGINTDTSDPTLTSDDEGYTYINTATGELKQWNGSSWNVLMTTPKTILDSELVVNIATTGDDSTADGSVSSPFATVNAAWQYVAENYQLSQSGYVILQLADGVYNFNDSSISSRRLENPFNTYDAAAIGSPRSYSVIIQGNLSDPEAVILEKDNATDASPILIVGPNIETFGLRNVKFRSSNNTNRIAIGAYRNGVFDIIGPVYFEGDFRRLIEARFNSSIEVLGSLHVVGNSPVQSVFYTDNGGLLILRDFIIEAGADLSFTEFVRCVNNSTVVANNFVLTNNGTVSGSGLKFSVGSNSNINRFNNDTNIFPGTGFDVFDTGCYGTANNNTTFQSSTGLTSTKISDALDELKTEIDSNSGSGISLCSFHGGSTNVNFANTTPQVIEFSGLDSNREKTIGTDFSIVMTGGTIKTIRCLFDGWAEISYRINLNGGTGTPGSRTWMEINPSFLGNFPSTFNWSGSGTSNGIVTVGEVMTFTGSFITPVVNGSDIILRARSLDGNTGGFNSIALYGNQNNIVVRRVE